MAKRRGSALWDAIDADGNGKVGLVEVDRVVCTKFPLPTTSLR